MSLIAFPFPPTSSGPTSGQRRAIGPLGAFAEGLAVTGATVPVPLVSTAIAIVARGHLATVTTRRRFRNAEAVSIEATLTYPVPIEAVAHGLVVRIGARTLAAEAYAKAAARARYEEAMDDGRTAVLHEEPLKGIHILSVGQVPPGAEVEVECIWTKVLTLVEGRSVLAVPTTVGGIYGRLALDIGDDLAVDGPPASAEVTVDGGDAEVMLCGEILSPGASRSVPLDRHIVVAFVDMAETQLSGMSADGRRVSLSVRPSAAGREPLDIVVLFDRSSSTSDAFRPATHRDSDRAVGYREGLSVHATALEALQAAVAARFGDEDRLTLWAFDDQADRLGEARGRDALDLVERLGPPRGGTEIGRAIAAVFSHEARPRDLLLLTDGRSGALDVHALASRGWRVSVLLCGPSSLDALPGHLAALTGGQLVAVGGGSDGVPEVTAAVTGMFGHLRHARAPTEASALARLPDRLVLRRGGARIAAAWTGDPTSGSTADALGAYAAALALPTLTERAATEVAVAHGLVTHLSSLLVVDTEGGRQSTIPSQRKVPLPHAAGSAPIARQSAMLRHCVEAPPPFPAASAPRAPSVSTAPAPTAPVQTLRRAASAIDWAADGPMLATGDLETLAGWIRDAVETAAEHPEVVAAAKAVRLDPVQLVIALMAAADGSDRTRARIARRIAGLPVGPRIARLIGL